MSAGRLALSALSLLAMLGALFHAGAASGARVAAASPGTSMGQAGAAEVEALLDSVVATQMAGQHIPGAAVVVVRDGEILVAKGYGYADLASERPVSPDDTLFRVASISKLFTWTAVMQLAEAGRLDLDADVNCYLQGFQVPATYPQPITLRHLMAHTAGFEGRSGGWARNAENLQPLGTYLAASMPARVRPPGEISAYSNYGAALAGYVVEQVSGVPFERYVEERIFEPLGMRHSTFRQPVPPELAPGLAVGYSEVQGALRPLGFEYLQTRPASAMSATAADMARFMIAHLQDGRYGEARILQEATARQMHSRLYAPDPRVSGMAYGFMEMHWNGHRILEHGGSIQAFQSELALMPDLDMGLFVVYNSETAGGAPVELLRLFLDRCYPDAVAPAAAPLVGKGTGTEQVVGDYALSVQVPSTTFDRLGALFMGCRVAAGPDGTLVTRGLGIGERHWAEAGPQAFREVGGQEMLVVRTDARGRATYLFPGNGAGIAYVRLPWYATLHLQGLLLVLSAGLFLSAMALWPWGRVAGGGPGLARWLVVGMSGLNLLFLLALGTALSDMKSVAYYGLSPLLRAVTWLPFLSALLAAGALACAALAVARGCWSPLRRVHYALIALGGLAFLWQLRLWNLWAAPW